MKKICIAITAILLFGNLNAQMVDETDQELRIDCPMLQENIEFDLQQYEQNLNAYFEVQEILEQTDDFNEIAELTLQMESYNELAYFHLGRSEQYSVIYSAICKGLL